MPCRNMSPARPKATNTRNRLDQPPRLKRPAPKRPMASSAAARKRMQLTPRRDTSAELRVRKLLHGMGLRYSVDASPVADSRRRADIVFRRAKVAVFVDGCFWHGCPKHGTWPRANKTFWHRKIISNMSRDRDTNENLRAKGWTVIRAWEHDDPGAVARRVAAVVSAQQLRQQLPCPRKRQEKA